MYQNRRKIIILVIITIIIIYFIYLIYKLKTPLLNTFLPFIVALVIAYLLNPLVSYIEHKGIPKILSIIIIYIIMLSAIIIIILFIIPLFINEISSLIRLIPKYTQNIHAIIKDIRNKYMYKSMPIGIQEMIDSNINRLERVILDTLQNILDSIILIITGFFSIIIAPILSFYLLKDSENIKKNLSFIIPSKYRKGVCRLSKEIDLLLGRYLRGQLIMSLIVGLMTTVGLTILNIDYAIIIGAIVGVSNIIPYFGPIIGALPAIAIASIRSPSAVIWVILVLALVQQIENCIISPKVLGDSVGLHPIVVILILIFGGSAFGFWGLIFSVPAAAIIKVFITFTVENITRVDKD